MATLDRGNGVALNYQVDGPDDGIPFLLTHGFGASNEMWQGQADALSDRFKIIRWDMRGHGQTQCPDDPALFTHDNTLADMTALLDHEGANKAIIGGHSLGGFMSMRFHAAMPERVRGLYLQACGPGYRKAEARDAWNQRAYERAGIIEEQGIDGLTQGSEAAASVRGTAQGLANAARGILTQVDATVMEDLPSIAVPTLILVDDQDLPFVDGTAYMEAKIPGAQRVVVEGATHGVNVDEPAIVNDALAAFLKVF